ncbi:hypothetical protein, partial [Alkaliphilus transvaalensis]|uniref:hypothetical protein n=1 Tax=Alkaliphilus transvaalensis TaxID=114628 RepID=UPI000479A816
MSEGVNEIVYYRRENSKLYAVVMSFIIVGFMSAILTLSILWPEEFTFGLTSNPLITLIRILLQLLLSIIWLHYAYILMRTIIIEYILKKPALIINEKGIYDNISYVRLGHISWDEIERVYPYETN